jgi:hypothetical protein
MNENKDIFREILKHGEHETPPEDFDDKVMKRVISESISKNIIRKPAISKVPVWIAIAGVIAVLVTSMIAVGGKDTEKPSFFSDIIPGNKFADISSTFNDLMLGISDISPLFLIISISVLFLLLFDLILNRRIRSE